MMKQNNENNFWIHKPDNCDKNNIVNIESRFINVNFISFLPLLFYLVLAL